MFTRKLWVPLAITAALLTGCGNNNATSNAGNDAATTGNDATTTGNAKPSANTTAVYAANSDVMTFWDPSDGNSNEVAAMNNIYEQLLRYDPVTDKFTPELASSYEKSDDSLTWTFHLQQGVKFHSGKVMTSADVKNSIERTIKHGKGAFYIWDSVDTIETPDANTVIFKLKYAAPIDLISSSPYAAYIFNTDVLTKEGDDYFSKAHEDGTGPYELKSWSTGKPLVLTKFNDYRLGWDGPHYENVVFQTVPDANTKAQMLKAGQITYSDILPRQQVESLASDSAVQVVKTASFQNLMAFFNTEDPQLKNPLVRQALSSAFPYEQVLNDLMKDTAHAANGPVPAGLWGHDDAAPAPKFDADKAKALLAQAGVQPASLQLSLTYTAGDSTQQQIANLYKATLAQLGVKLDVQPMPWDAQWELAKSPADKRQDIFMMYFWPDYSNPYGFLFPLFHSEDSINFNLSYYKNANFDKLIDDANAQAGTNRDQAIKTYSQALKTLNDDAPAIWIYDQQNVRVVSSSLKNFVDNPSYSGVVFWYDVQPQ